MTKQTIDVERLKTDPAYWDSVAPGGAELFCPKENGLQEGWYKFSRGEWFFWGTAHDDWIRSIIKPGPNERAEKIERPTESPELHVVLRECADHVAVGQDPLQFFESKDRGYRCQRIEELVELARKGQLRRRRPTVFLNGKDIPAPERIAPERGQEYFCLADPLDGSAPDTFRTWSGSTRDQAMLRNGQVYLNQEDRDEAAQAIISALRGEGG